MALWRDPLEELIGELERTQPSRVGAADFDMPPPFEDVQLAVHATLNRTPEDRARAEQDPRVQAVWAYYERLGRHLDEERRRHGQPGEDNTE